MQQDEHYLQLSHLHTTSLQSYLYSQWSKCPKFVSLHYSALLTYPQGCQKIWTNKLMSTLVSWSTKIQPKLKKLWKTIKIEQKLSKKPCFLKVFQISSNLVQILALQLTKVVFSLVFRIFDTPATLGGVSSFKICFWYFCTAAQSDDFFILFKMNHMYWFNSHKM